MYLPSKVLLFIVLFYILMRRLSGTSRRELERGANQYVQNFIDVKLCFLLPLLDGGSGGSKEKYMFVEHYLRTTSAVLFSPIGAWRLICLGSMYECQGQTVTE